MRHLLWLALLPFALVAQENEIKISRWPNGATAAYTIMHDDFCMDHASGIAEYADSIALSHDINFDFPVVTNHCDSIDWAKAKEMIANGHEISNHSHNHYCGIPVSWCPTEKYDTSDFQAEYDLSTELIIQNTGQKPDFFIFPFDLHTGAMHKYLTAHGYRATRSGPQSGINHPTTMDLKKVGFQVLRPEQGIEELNELVDLSIKTRQWGVRVTHGVNDASWGAISLKDYEAHMSYLESKKNSGELWVSTITPILNYIETTKTSSLKLISNTKNQSTYKLRGNDPKVELTIQLRTNREINSISVDREIITAKRQNGYILFNIQIGSAFIIKYK